MQKFIVLYCMPIEGLEAWSKVPEAERKSQEDALKAKWDAWLRENAALLAGPTAAVGKTKRVTAGATADAKNDIMLYTVAQGDSQEAVAKAFESHPHLEIPGAWIDVSPLTELPAA